MTPASPDAVAKVLDMRVSAAPPGEHVRNVPDYPTGARGTAPLHIQDPPVGTPRWLRRNATHCVEPVAPRPPHADVFRIERA